MLRASVISPAGDLDAPDDGRVLLWSGLYLGDLDGPFMTGARWPEIYEAQLAEALERRRDEKGFDVAGFRVLLSVSRARGAVELKGEDALVRVWSDLHLGDADALTFFGRPLRSVDEMDDMLLGRWRSSVDSDDFVLCLHGHLHVGTVKGSTAHVNVSIAQLDYRPRRLTDLRRLAAVLARGRSLPGRNTARWLEELDELA